LVLDGRNLLSSSKPCAYCRIVWLELKLDSVLTVLFEDTETLGTEVSD